MFELIVAVLVFLFPLAYSPGPGNMTFAANGAAFGARATLIANLGYHIATWVATLAIGLGVMSVMDPSSTAFQIVKILGALYVLYLAWKLSRSAPLSVEANYKPQVIGFVDGVMLLVLNPKAYVIIALLFSQFLEQFSERSSVPVLLLTTIFTLNNMLCFCLWALVGTALAKQFQTPIRAKRFNTTFAVMLALVACLMFIV